MAEILTHSFINPKVDSADGTITGSSEWNDGHSFAGGADGNILIRDSGQPKGIRWAQGPKITMNSGSYSGAAPSGDLASTVLTFTSNVSVILAVNGGATIAASGTWTISLRRNGVEVAQQISEGTGFFKCTRVFTIDEVAGTYTYSIVIPSAGGNVTLANVTLVTFSIGR